MKAIFLVVCGLTVIVFNLYVGWQGLPVTLSIVGMAVLHTAFRVTKRMMLHADDHEPSDMDDQAEHDDADRQVDAETDADNASAWSGVINLYVIMMFVAAFWYGIGYGVAYLMT